MRDDAAAVYSTTPVSSPPASSVSQYSSKSLLDLRLMHHYCIFTAPGFAGTFPEKVLQALQVEIPALACRHVFLMDAILLVAMVHLCCTDPASLDNMPVYYYRDQALKSLRHAVANISDDSTDAVRGASVLLAHISFATDRVTQQPGLWVANWMALALGQRNFRGLSWSSNHQYDGRGMYSSRTAPHGSADHLSVATMMPSDIHRALARENNDENPASESALRTAATELGRLTTIVQLPYQTIDLEKQVKAWSFDLVPTEFHKMVQHRNPKALIILAYYLVLFKLLPESWLYQDLVNHDIEEIDQLISPEWQLYMSTPRLALQIDNKEEVIQLLGSSLSNGIGESEKS
ncbi:hypothetical protein PFICI_11275 [Pestalotiopsis fici W106-1]|uniref:Transcription factor domain-containing protein n=1 Tax=Pestalotiopsis fici (strain W106-1 / CGMCC3.15140) TaxID=1229662 RepID=W3WX04_PESFW|nr:uncharacterized protein PFICI_11275 [Pestalotiopsis fici W106-1]ETS77401.1 hypothetical protein PFICI_11275 [Pestalotiopsis fici W106-1]